MNKRRLKQLLIGLAVVIGLIFITIFGLIAFSKLRIAHQQAKLAPFYDTAGLTLEGPIGEIVRQEPLGTPIEGGNGVRILYRTQQANGAPTFASGMIFIPDTPSDTPRPVLAWAHGTLGMGDQCAPTRTPNPTIYVPGLTEMLQNGWVVAATDYAGLGTPGTLAYLVGTAEAHDVINSVRAAQLLPEANASKTFAVWGHSQGGHSALFTGQQAAAYAPELQLVGTAATAPAAELIPLLDQQYNTAAAWVIGPEVVTAWTAYNDQLSMEDIVTPVGKRNYQKIAQKCIEAGAVEGLMRNHLGQQFFAGNPIDQPDWRAEAEQQTAPILTPQQPLMVAESTTDQVVLPNTTALYIQTACNAGSNLTSLWVSDVTHMKLAQVIAPDVIAWLGDRYAGRPATSSCSQSSPVTPAPAS